MDKGSSNPAVRQIRTLYSLGSVSCLTDTQLIDRFLGGDGPDRDDAFAALVWRHGPMVLGVCRRMLGGSADADDAFQAVFLVLARKAGAIRRAEGLKPWLYGVAVRTTKESLKRSARRRAREGGAMDESRAVPSPDAERNELLALVDEELDRLPSRYRDPLLLCELEGVSRRDAAQRLGLPEGTLSSRLSRGRSLLRDRLARRGATLGTGMLAALHCEPTSAVLPERLALATVRLASQFTAAGGTMAGSGAVDRLACAVEQTGFPWANPVPTAVLACGCLAALWAGWVGASGGVKPVQPAPKSPITAPAAAPAMIPVPEDPLPAGASLRFGSPRFRHTTTIQNLAVSHDGSVAVASSGTLLHASVRAYELATGKVCTAFDEARDVEAVALSPDGKTLATKTLQNDGVELYDTTTGKSTGRIGYPGANPSSETSVLGFSPDGQKIVVAAATGTALHLIDLAQGAVIRTLPHAEVVYAAEFSPDGKQLVAGGYDREENEYFARLWEVDTGRELCQLAFGKGGIRCVAYAPDGTTIAVGGDSRNSIAVKLFDAATGQERRAIPFPGASSVRSVAFSPDGKTLAASGGSSTRLFDAATGQELRTIDRRAIGLRFSPDGATLVGAVGGTIFRWDVATGRSLIPEGGESLVNQIAVTPDGQRIVTLGQDGDAHIWDARTGAHQRRVNASWQRGIALSPDGRFLAWPEADASIEFPDPDDPRMWHTGSRLRMIDLADGTPAGRFEGFEGQAQELGFTDGGKSLVTVERYGREARVRIWNVATGQVERSLPAPGEPETRVWRSRLSSDGTVLAVTYQKIPEHGLGQVTREPVRLWDLASGKQLDQPPPHWAEVEVMAFGPDATTIAVPKSDGTIEFQDATTGQVRGEFREPRGRVTALAFGPDGRLFTGALDATVLAWDLPAANGPPADRK